jgi:hypothetical protein
MLAKSQFGCITNYFHKMEPSKADTTWLFMKVPMPIKLYSTIIVFAVWIVQQVYRRDLQTRNFRVEEQSVNQSELLGFWT